MTYISVLPFKLKRKKEDFGAASMTTTTETVHGLLRLDGEQVEIQWRLARKTEKLGAGITTTEELEGVREVTLPLNAIAGAYVRRRWWEFWRGPRLIINASDLEAFEDIAGPDGLRLAHPAQLVLGLRFRDRLPGEEFAAEVELAVARHGLEPPSEVGRLEAGPEESVADGPPDASG